MPDERSVKQVIVIRKDLGMRRGKEIAQGAHAAMAWMALRMRKLLPATPAGRTGSFIVLSEAEIAWITGSLRKITCQVSSLADLMAVYDAARETGLEAHLITDNGATEFSGVPTITALAVGPDYADLMDPVTGKLELY